MTRDRESHEKNCSETRRNMGQIGRFYIRLLMSICTKKLLSPSPGLFLAGTSLTLLLDTVDTSVSSFFDIIFFQHRNKTKIAIFIRHRRKTTLLHTLSQKCLKLFEFIISLLSKHSIPFSELSEIIHPR